MTRFMIWDPNKNDYFLESREDEEYRQDDLLHHPSHHAISNKKLLSTVETGKF